MLIIGFKGTQLQPHEREWLRQPVVSGTILFSRNFSSRDQVAALIEDIRSVRSDEFFISVDQEGGPVQRFREGFTRLPAIGRIGERFAADPKRAVELAEEHAWLMASEMRAIDIDLSYAPVLDLDRGNRIIGERSFSADPAIVSQLGLAYLRGMRLAGMAATIKHFPGHGSVREDTHVEAAVDRRTIDEMREADMLPFVDAVNAGAEAVMMGHVTYPDVDSKPAGYSRVWIEDILRGELNFRGVVMSDDISMAAAEGAGNIGARISAHRDAGCDLVLVCKPDVVAEAIASQDKTTPCASAKVATLRGGIAQTWDKLIDNPQRDRFLSRITALNAPAVSP
jgi:beta-N-acetylhexosaminidase